MERQIEGNIEDWNLNDVSKAEAVSETHLEDDEGHGDPVILRCFEFAANPEAFKQHTPTKQELFNHHQKGIEALLWADGMQPVPEIEPRVVVNKKQTKYHIFVGACAARGHVFSYKDTPQTLSNIIHDAGK